MKLLCFLLLSATLVASPDVSNLDCVAVVTSNDGAIQDVLKNYPSQSAAIKTAITSDLSARDELTAQRKLATLQSRGVAISQAVKDAVAARVETLRVAKEAALRSVADKDIARAKAKLDELVAAGLPVTQATRDYVNGKVPAPSPTPTPTATPVPDGL